MRTQVAAFIILTALGVSPAPKAQAPAADDDVDRYVLAEMKRQQIPGLSLAVVKDGKLEKARGYGLANVEHEVAATERTIYQSGSVGKQFTAAGVLLLAEDGKLSLEDRITKYFPNAPPAWARSRSGTCSPTPRASGTTPTARSTCGATTKTTT